MDRDKALEKIKKCLALAGSSEPHEAAAAMRQAQKLMAEHGLSGIDVELADVAESTTPAKSNMLPNWEVSLARVVANSFGCDFYITRGFITHWRMKPERKTDYAFVGLHANAQIASYAFSVLQRQCVADRSAHVQKQPKRLKSTTRTARGDAFAMGWVVAVRDLLDKLAGCESHAQLIEHYMSREHPDMAEANVKRRELNRHVRDDSFTDGHQAGKKAQLHKGVSSEKKHLLT